MQQVDQVPIGAPFDLDFALGGNAVSEVTVTAAPTVRTRRSGPVRDNVQRQGHRHAAIVLARPPQDLVRLNPFVTVDEAGTPTP